MNGKALCVAILVCFGLSGCDHEGKSSRQAAAGKTATVALARNPTITHCRLAYINNEEVSWPIGKATLADFLSGNNGLKEPEYQYRIFESHHSPSSPDARVVKGDHMIVYDDGGGAKLIHYGWRAPTLGRGFSRETEYLTLSADGLYAMGDYKNSSGVVGTYYLFWVGEGPKCKYTNPPSGTCKRLHFEYFLSNDARDYVPPKKIIEVPGTGCSSPHQTDDGDGDEGLR